MKEEIKLAVRPKGLFVFVDDDHDEQELLKIAMDHLGLDNPVHTCVNGEEALNFLKTCTDDIFLILSDLNMPKMDGLEFKRMIDLIPEIKIKAIPFFFHSNTSSRAEVKAAYASNIQGFLKKADSVSGTVYSLTCLINLWTTCVHPKDLHKSEFRL